MNIREHMIKQDERLAKVQFFCEATTTESHFLWSQFCKDTIYPTKHSTHTWIQDYSGRRIFVGHAFPSDDYTRHSQGPIHIEVWYFNIDGHDVCFYYPIGQYTDWQLIDVAMKSINRSATFENADNFHMILNAIKELNDAEKLRTTQRRYDIDYGFHEAIT